VQLLDSADNELDACIASSRFCKVRQPAVSYASVIIWYYFYSYFYFHFYSYPYSYFYPYSDFLLRFHEVVLNFCFNSTKGGECLWRMIDRDSMKLSPL